MTLTRIVSVLVFMQIADAATISGIVTNEDGKPIVNARIDHTGLMVVVGTDPERVPPAPGDIRTDSEGRFRVTTTAPAVVVRKPGYASQRLFISGDEEVRVKLQRMKEKHLCHISPSPQVKTQDMNDIDYTATLVYIETKHGKPGVLSGSGPLYSFGAPSDSYVWRSSEYSGVMYETGMIDASGRFDDRDYWRVRSVFLAEAHYFHVTRETAELLDCVMDTITPEYRLIR